MSEKNRVIADFGLTQKRPYQQPQNANLHEMGNYPFEDDQSEYSCV